MENNPDRLSILNAAAALYDLSPVQLKPLIGGHFNAVYEFYRDGADYVLRITPPSNETDLSAHLAILEWMHYLSTHGAAVPNPLHSVNGCLVEAIDALDGTYLVGAFQKARGVLAETLSFDQWNNSLYFALGKTVGKLHALAKYYVPASVELTRSTWDQSANCFNPTEALDPAHALVQDKKDKIWDYIQSLPKDRDSYGLIHTDLHCANLFVDVENCSITIFDFDDCAYGWYVMDIAMLLLDALVLSNEPDREAFAARFLQNFLAGYTTENQLSPFWFQQLPQFLKLLEIGLFSMVSSEYDLQDRDSWVGRFMFERQARIENDVPYGKLDFSTLLATKDT